MSKSNLSKKKSYIQYQNKINKKKSFYEQKKLEKIVTNINNFLKNLSLQQDPLNQIKKFLGNFQDQEIVDKEEVNYYISLTENSFINKNQLNDISKDLNREQLAKKIKALAFITALLFFTELGKNFSLKDFFVDKNDIALIKLISPVLQTLVLPLATFDNFIAKLNFLPVVKAGEVIGDQNKQLSSQVYTAHESDLISLVSLNKFGGGVFTIPQIDPSGKIQFDGPFSNSTYIQAIEAINYKIPFQSVTGSFSLVFRELSKKLLEELKISKELASFFVGTPMTISDINLINQRYVNCLPHQGTDLDTTSFGNMMKSIFAEYLNAIKESSIQKAKIISIEGKEFLQEYFNKIQSGKIYPKEFTAKLIVKNPINLDDLYQLLEAQYVAKELMMNKNYNTTEIDKLIAGTELEINTMTDVISNKIQNNTPITIADYSVINQGQINQLQSDFFALSGKFRLEQEPEFQAKKNEFQLEINSLLDQRNRTIKEVIKQLTSLSKDQNTEYFTANPEEYYQNIAIFINQLESFTNETKLNLQEADKNYTLFQNLEKNCKNIKESFKSLQEQIKEEEKSGSQQAGQAVIRFFEKIIPELPIAFLAASLLTYGFSKIINKNLKEEKEIVKSFSYLLKILSSLSINVLMLYQYHQQKEKRHFISSKCLESVVYSSIMSYSVSRFIELSSMLWKKDMKFSSEIGESILTISKIAMGIFITINLDFEEWQKRNDSENVINFFVTGLPLSFLTFQQESAFGLITMVYDDISKLSNLCFSFLSEMLSEAKFETVPKLIDEALKIENKINKKFKSLECERIEKTNIAAHILAGSIQLFVYMVNLCRTNKIDVVNVILGIGEQQDFNQKPLEREDMNEKIKQIIEFVDKQNTQAKNTQAKNTQAKNPPSDTKPYFNEKLSGELSLFKK